MFGGPVAEPQRIGLRGALNVADDRLGKRDAHGARATGGTGGEQGADEAASVVSVGHRRGTIRIKIRRYQRPEEAIQTSVVPVLVSVQTAYLESFVVVRTR